MVEDFDEDFAREHPKSSKVVTEEDTSQTVDLDTIPVSTSEGVEDSLAQDSQEHNDGDTNLFEEEIRLVDCNDTGSDAGFLGPTADVAREASPSTLEPLQLDSRAPFVAADAGLLIHASAAMSKKSKGKRRFTQPRKDPNEPIILILDSLGQTRSGTVRALKDWLAAEGKAKRGMEAVIKENGYYPKATQIPMQDNWSDCGVYLLGYAYMFFRDPDSFKKKLLEGEMSAVTDWPSLKPKDMRGTIRNVIFQFAQDQEKARKEEKRRKRVLLRPDLPVSPRDGNRVEPTRDESPSKLGLAKNDETALGRPVDSGALETKHPSPKEGTMSTLTSPAGAGAPPAETTEQQQASHVVDTRSELPPAMRGKSNRAFANLPSQLLPRRSSPEVRIVNNKPQQSRETSPQSADERKPHFDTRALLPVNNQGQFNDEDPSEVPADTRRSTASSPQSGDDGQSPSSASRRRERAGSAADIPIEIVDSQDAKAPASHMVKALHDQSPAQRHQVAHTHTMQRSDRTPSVEAIVHFDSTRGSVVAETPEADLGH